MNRAIAGILCFVFVGAALANVQLRGGGVVSDPVI